MLSKVIRKSIIEVARLNRDAVRKLSLASTQWNKLQYEQRSEWSNAVKEAEKVVGYPTSFMNVRWLLNDEVANIALHLRKLIGTEHPLLKTVKNLLQNNDTSAWGLVVLLMSKAGGFNAKNKIDEDKSAGILHSQRVLAEVTEMIRTSIMIQKGLLSIDPNQEDADIMLHGNKIALLTGDYLLSKSVHELACLKNHDVNEIISSTIRDFAEYEFLGPRDVQNEELPAKPRDVLEATDIFDENNTDFGPYAVDQILGNPRDEWVLRGLLGGANLLGKSCKSTLILGERDEDLQTQAYLFGKHLALAWQVKFDLGMFMNSDDVNLVSAPVMLHLQKDPSLYEEIIKGAKHIEDCDYDKIRKIVKSGRAIEESKELQEELIERALKNIKCFEDSVAKRALENIIHAL